MVNKELLAPCGLYCGVCAILMAHRDNNQKFKEVLAPVYGVEAEQIVCQGCMSDEKFIYCETCKIRDCALEHKYEGCHQCSDFPCKYFDDMSFEVGKKVISRAIPQWRELGTEKWVALEEERYHCPNCGFTLFRGAQRCRNCKEPVDVD